MVWVLSPALSSQVPTCRVNPGSQWLQFSSRFAPLHIHHHTSTGNFFKSFNPYITPYLLFFPLSLILDYLYRETHTLVFLVIPSIPITLKPKAKLLQFCSHPPTNTSLNCSFASLHFTYSLKSKPSFHFCHT